MKLEHTILAAGLVTASLGANANMHGVAARADGYGSNSTKYKTNTSDCSNSHYQ
jgi:hypothetical protein